MTENEFNKVRETVWKNLLDQTENLKRPPTYEEFRAITNRIKQAVFILLPE